MTSARGHGAIVYCLNSGSDDTQIGSHNGDGEEEPCLEGEKEKTLPWIERTEEESAKELLTTLQSEYESNVGLVRSPIQPQLSNATLRDDIMSWFGSLTAYDSRLLLICICEKKTDQQHVDDAPGSATRHAPINKMYNASLATSAL
ncbi:hypothetical protein TNCV_1898641 [Trichonephila clavipes]|nr:hypothetical protein TNCV_1898641 [Trichonephila clavipes]